MESLGLQELSKELGAVEPIGGVRSGRLEVAVELRMGLGVGREGIIGEGARFIDGFGALKSSGEPFDCRFRICLGGNHDVARGFDGAAESTNLEGLGKVGEVQKVALEERVEDLINKFGWQGLLISVVDGPEVGFEMSAKLRSADPIA